jgi:hypothetical protein
MAIGDGLTGAPYGVARAVVALLAAEAVYRVAIRSHVRRAVGMTLHDELVAPIAPEHAGPYALVARGDGATP